MAENDLSDALSARALDTIDTVVATVNDKAVRPAVVAARSVVFGIIIGVVAVTVLILFCVMFIRITTIAGHRIWASYLVLGLLFCIVGAILYSRRGLPPMPDASPERRKVVIVGSGPAGLTAALYTARAQLQPLVIEGEPSSTSDQPGGQLMLTTDVENYPGFVDGVMGPELMGMMRAQALRFDAELRTAKVSRLDLTPWPFEVWVGDPGADQPTFRADTLIIATGARSLMLGCPNEDRLLGYGVSTCATCDGFFFRGQHIAVAGGGDSAMEEANFLTRFADKVTVIHRRDQLRASKIMQERAFANPKIEFRWNSVITDIMGDTKVAGLGLQDTVTGEASQLDVTGLFVAIGHEPNSSLLKGQLELQDNGYVRTFDGTTRTSVDGVFACGDVQDDYYRQAVTSAGSGCMAAIDAERWLEMKGE